MPKFRKKPVEIEAHQLTVENINQLAHWCKGHVKGTKLPVKDQCIEIQTLEGEMEANIGDYIIKGIENEFYPCKESIFKASYVEAANLDLEENLNEKAKEIFKLGGAYDIPEDREDLLIFANNLSCSDGFGYGLFDSGYISPDDIIIPGPALEELNKAIRLVGYYKELYENIATEV